MSKRRKRQFRLATFSVLPVVLILAVLVPLFLASSAPVGATNTSDLAKVKGYAASYISNQYAADSVYGESGFVIDRDTLKTRLDSNGDMNTTTGAGVLGEGDNAGTAPVLIDNLNQAGVIPGTSIQCTWNSGAGTTNCFDATKVAAVKAKVDAHAAAGFSTDIVDYCLSGHTEAPTTGGWGYLAQAPNALGTGITPKVYAFKWGRNGWVGTAHAAYSNSNPLTPTATPGSYTPPSTVAAASACNSSVSDAELMRCQVQWAIYNGTVGGMTGGNVGNGISPTGTSPNQTLAGSQFVDIRTGNPNSAYLPVGPTISDPINEIFTDAGLAKINSGLAGGTTGVIVLGRTQMTGGIVAMGLKMLGEPVGTNGFLNSGMPNWNNAQDEKQNTVALSPAYPVPAPAIDATAPTVNANDISAGTITADSAIITRTTASEPATMKVEYGTTSGVYTNTANSTILNQSNKTVNLTGLSEYTTYFYRVTSYDGQANGTVTAEKQFTTLDVTNPTITNVSPADGSSIYSASSAMSADLSDTGGIGIDTDPGVTMVHVDTAMIMSGCTITSSSVSCPKSGLAYGPHTLEIFTADLAGNPATSTTGFNVGDNVNPTVTYTGPTGTSNDTSPTITGTVSDPVPSAGINATTGATLSLDNGSTFPYTCTITGSDISCPVTGPLPDATYPAQIKVTDNSTLPSANTGYSVSTDFTVDATDPVISNVSPADGSSIYSASSAMSADLSDTGGSGIDTDPGVTMVHVDTAMIMSGCTITSSSVSCPKSGLAYGPHTLEIFTADLAGNPATSTTGFNVGDNVNPTVTYTSPAGTISDNSPTITGTVSDPAPSAGINATTGATLSLDNGSTFPYACTITGSDISCPVAGPLTGSPATLYHAQIKVTDDSALPSANTGYSAITDFTVDTTAPTVVADPIGTQPGNWVTDTTPALSATISGVPGGENIMNTASVEIDGSPCTGTVSYSNTAVSCTPASPLGEGAHTVIYSAEYTAGHAGSDTQTINIDSIAPAISSILPSGSITTTDADVSVYYSDGGSGIDTASVAVTLNGTDITSECTVVTSAYASCPRTGLGQGSNSIDVSVADLLNTATDSGTFFVDTKAPKASSIQPRNATGAGWASTSATITAYVIDVAPMWPVAANSGVNSSTIAVTFDGSPVAGCTLTPTTYGSDEPLEFATTNPTRVDVPAQFLSCPEITGLSQGNHVIVVTENDAVGNSGSNTRTFKVDTVAPSITNLSPSGAVGSTSVTISADLSDGTGTGIDTAASAIYLDGAGTPLATGCTSTATSISCPATIGLGAHNFSVYTRDKNGFETTDTSGSFSLTQQNYFWAWYDNVNADNWVLAANPTSASENVYVDMSVGGVTQACPDGGLVAPGMIMSHKYDDLMDGPVKVTSTTGANAILSQRTLWPKGGNSLEEVLAINENSLSDHFWWTWYDEQSPGYRDWVLIANPTADTVRAEIRIAGELMTDTATGEQYFDIAPGAEVGPEFPGVMNGPVEVKTYLATGSWPADARNVMASQRVLSNGGLAFNEVPGIADSELTTDYLWTWYDSTGPGRDWVLMSNPGGSTVRTTVTIAGNLMTNSATGEQYFDLAPGESVGAEFAGVKDGPVQVTATGGSIIASQRATWGPSFEEVPGYATASLASDYHWTWYDGQSAGARDWVLVANPSASATVHYVVKIAGVTKSEGDLLPGAFATPEYPTEMNGPVEVISTGGPVMASQRVLWNGYFNETLGTVLP